MVGKMKDEIAGIRIEEFARLKPKMYSYLVDDTSEHKKANSILCWISNETFNEQNWK